MNTESFFNIQARICEENDSIESSLYKEYGVKRGLRDENGNGVLTGLTNISEVSASRIIDGKKVPADGRLLYRGINVRDLVNGVSDKDFIFEEACYLLIFGVLPTKLQLEEFHNVLIENMRLPTNFTRDVIMKAPSKDIMNSITRSVLTLASYDPKVSDLSVENVLRQCISLISIFPMLAVYGYHAYNHYEKDGSMYIHRPDPNLSVSENFLRMLRPDKKFTHLEAKALDIALLLHMEHGGGNNSTFTTRVVTSSGTDTYSAIAAALCSLKGSRHGGANIMVVDMLENICENVGNTEDEEELSAYLEKILHKEAFDKKGLIYGIGHAIYSLSDPREVILKGFAERLAASKNMEKEYNLYKSIEKLAPMLIAKERHMFKGVSPNVDFYSGFVYNMLNIPKELFTPLFAVARICGWSAHRIEEIISANKIIRPAYMSVAPEVEYIPIDKR